MKNSAGLEWRIEKRGQGWALGLDPASRKSRGAGHDVRALCVAQPKSGENVGYGIHWGGSRGIREPARLSGQDTVDGVAIDYEMEVALKKDLPAASFTAKWSVDKPLTGWELCLAYHEGFHM